MQIACLMPDESVFEATRNHLAAHQVSCARFVDDASLLHMFDRLRVDAILVDVGHDSAMEARVLLWVECGKPSGIPLLIQGIDLGSDRVARALQAGVADVLPRAADAVELAARLRVAVRRHQRGESVTRLDIAGFHLDRSTHLASWRGVKLNLTTREFSLAWLMFSNPGSCLSRKTISVVVWGSDEDVSNRTMEQHVHRIRRKMGLDETGEVTLRAVYGRGYQLSIANRSPRRSSADDSESSPLLATAPGDVFSREAASGAAAGARPVAQVRTSRRRFDDLPPLQMGDAVRTSPFWRRHDDPLRSRNSDACQGPVPRRRSEDAIAIPEATRRSPKTEPGERRRANGLESSGRASPARRLGDTMNR